MGKKKSIFAVKGAQPPTFSNLQGAPYVPVNTPNRIKRPKLKKKKEHKKNIYKKSYPIAACVRLFPDFKQYVKENSSGFVIDFKDKMSLYALTECLLKKDFNLNVKFPPESVFVPDIRTRLELILWIEDMLASFKANGSLVTNTYRAIEIHSESSCAYPLLAASKNPSWSIVAGEVGLSFYKGMENVKASNWLSNRVIVKQITPDWKLSSLMENDTIYDFCIYAPMYFKNKDCLVGMGKITKSGNKQFLPKDKCSPAVKKLMKPNGEFDFLMKLVHESLLTRKRIRVYVVHSARKMTLTKLIKTLKAQTNYVAIDQLFSGYNFTNVVAWTFYPELKLQELTTSIRLPTIKIPVAATPPNPLKHTLKNTSLTECMSRVQYLLDYIRVPCPDRPSLYNAMFNCIYDLVADEITWVDPRAKETTIDEGGESDLEDLTSEDFINQCGGGGGSGNQPPVRPSTSCAVLKPVLQFSLMLNVAPNGADTLIKLSKSLTNPAEQSALESLMEFLKTNWNKPVLPNYF